MDDGPLHTQRSLSGLSMAAEAIKLDPDPLAPYRISPGFSAVLFRKLFVRLFKELQNKLNVLQKELVIFKSLLMKKKR